MWRTWKPGTTRLINLFLNGNDFSNLLIILPHFFLNVVCSVNKKAGNVSTCRKHLTRDVVMHPKSPKNALSIKMFIVGQDLIRAGFA
jgi:hypothetical protein